MPVELVWGVILALTVSTGGNVAMWVVILNLRKEITKLSAAIQKVCPWGPDKCPSFNKARSDLSEGS